MRPNWTKEAVEYSRDDALEWLSGNSDGYPRSWEQEDRDAERRGYHMYDDPDFQAPPIAGYEALEAAGHVERIGLVTKSGQERIHFRLTDAGRSALEAIGEKEE